MAWPLGLAVTWHREVPGPKDADGNATTITVDEIARGVALYPLDGEELIERGDLVNDFRRLVANPPIDVGPRDSFTIRGKTWKVDGPAAQYESPLSGTHLTSVVLKRTTG